MRALLAATLLAGCADWTNLECDVRMACGGDGLDGSVAAPLPLDVVARFPEASPSRVVGFARGAHSWLLGTTSGLFNDGGFTPLQNLAALDAAGDPARYWLASADGHVRAQDEGTGATLDPMGQSGFMPLALTAYREQTGVAAAVFGGNTPYLQVAGYLDVPLGTETLSCPIGGPDSAAAGGLTVSIVAGATQHCDAVDGGLTGYVAAFLPRSASNFVVPLKSEPSPGRVRVGSNGDIAVAVMETDEGLAAVRLRPDGPEAAPALSLRIEADAGNRGFLDDVEQLASPDRFVIVLTNRTASPARASTAGGTGAFVLAPGETAVVGVVWNSGVPAPAQAWGLPLGAPDDLRLDADPANTDVWLAASCNAPAGPCADTVPGKLVLRLPGF